ARGGAPRQGGRRAPAQGAPPRGAGATPPPPRARALGAGPPRAGGPPRSPPPPPGPPPPMAGPTKDCFSPSESTMRTTAAPAATLLLSLRGLAAQNPYVRPNARIAAIADLRASRVGDILTITIQEQHTVKNDDKVDRKQDSTLSARLDAFTLSDKAFHAGSLPR